MNNSKAAEIKLLPAATGYRRSITGKLQQWDICRIAVAMADGEL